MLYPTERKKIKKIFKGLTLIELLVVIVLIGLLTSASYLVGKNYLKKAKDAKRKMDLERIKTTLYDYYFDQNCFPKNLPDCGQNFNGSMVYLGNFPCDPLLKTTYGYQVQDKECSQWFKILTNLENTRDPDIRKVGCQAGCGPECQYNYGLSSTNIKINQGCIVYYACGPSGECGAFDNPWCSRCPEVFENDPTCGGGCDCEGPKKKINCCHDERGKHVPEGGKCEPEEKE